MQKLFLYASMVFICGISSLNAQGKFSGYMFGDYYYNVMRDSSFYHTAPSNSASGSAAPGPQTMQAFQFRRIYLTYDNDISEQFTARFRLEADQASNASNGKIGTFVKDAYLRWKNIFTGSDLIFGIQPTPAFDISEAAWGYRSLEKTIMDLRGIVSSRDLGISLKGKLTSDGTLNYWTMLANNSSNSPETDKYKRYYAYLQLRPSNNFQATVYVDYKDAAKIAAGENGTLTTALFVGYAEPFSYNINAEGFLVSQSNAFTPTGGSIGSKSGMGISLFGSCNIIPELALVGRYDYFDPNTNSAVNAKGDVRNYFIGGLSWKVDKNVSIMPNILYETYEALQNHGEPDPSITARVTVYYVFL
jgi:hypothetical protein